MSVPASLSSRILSASQTTASTLDTRSIEEIMSALYLTAYGPANKAQIVEGFDIFQNLAAFAFTSSAQHPQHRFLDQRLMEGPTVVYVAQQVHDARNPIEVTGKKTLCPMVPILKANYFDVEAFDKMGKEKLVSDDISSILWSKRYTTELPFNASDESNESGEELDMSNRFLHLPSDISPGEKRWRDIVQNPSALPRAVFRNPYNEEAISHRQDSKGIEVWFPSATGEALHPTRIILSDKYILVPLLSSSDGLSSGSRHGISKQNSESTCVDPRQVNMLFNDEHPKTDKGAVTTKKMTEKARSVRKKPSTTRKYAAVNRSRSGGLRKSAEFESERTPQQLSCTQFFVTSASVPTNGHHLSCWLPQCTGTFKTAEELAVHHDSYHHGQQQGPFCCPYGGCEQKTTRLGDMKRHIITKRHVGDLRSLVCDHVGCKKIYTRQDALRRHPAQGTQADGVMRMRA